jgi:hypothetical protein
MKKNFYQNVFFVPLIPASLRFGFERDQVSYLQDGPKGLLHSLRVNSLAPY